MKKSVDRVAFLSRLQRRPALIKAVADMASGIAMLPDALRANIECVKHIPEDWKTPEVCDLAVKAILEQDTKATSYWYDRGALLLSLPEQYRRDMPLEYKQKMVALNSNSVQYLYPDQALWMHAAKMGFAYVEEIPREMLTKELAAVILAKHQHKFQSFPEDFWTEENTNYVVAHAPDCLWSATPSLVSAESLRRAFKAKDVDLPATFKAWRHWSRELAEMATAQGCNLGVVPDRLKTAEMCLRCVNLAAAQLEHVPPKLRTRDLCLTAVATGYHLGEHIPQEFRNDPEFQVDTARLFAQLHASDRPENRGRAFRDHRHSLGAISAETWLRILDLMPEAVMCIDKDKQTSEMVRLVLERLPAKDAEVFAAQYLAKSKITKDLVVLLLGAKDKDVQELLARKLNPSRGSKNTAAPAPVTAAAGEVLVDLSPKDLAELNL